MHHPPPPSSSCFTAPPPHHHIIHHRPSGCASATGTQQPPPLPIRRTIAAHLDPCALRIHNVPTAWPGADFSLLLQRLAATDVQPLSTSSARRHGGSGHSFSSYFARFPTAARAYDALWYLHQRQCADRVLHVEYAPHGDHHRRQPQRQASPSSFRGDRSTGSGCATTQQQAAEAQPTQERCAAIAAAMLRHPRLYRAVLHLMRRLKVPAAVAMDDEEDVAPVVDGSDRNIEDVPAAEAAEAVAAAAATTDDDDDESEMSSDDDGASSRTGMMHTAATAAVAPSLRRRATTAAVDMLPAKRLRQVQQFGRGAAAPILNAEAALVSVRPAIQIVVPAQLPAKMTTTTTTEVAVASGSKPSESCERLSAAEMSGHKLFATYEAGTPCRRLYVKNLPQSMTELRLRELIADGGGANGDGDDGVVVHVRLGGGGRMHGQAFVTFATGDAVDDDNDADEDDARLVERAEEARMRLNGRLVGGRPAVVVFGRRRQRQVRN